MKLQEIFEKRTKGKWEYKDCAIKSGDINVVNLRGAMGGLETEVDARFIILAGNHFEEAIQAMKNIRTNLDERVVNASRGRSLIEAEAIINRVLEAIEKEAEELCEKLTV